MTKSIKTKGYTMDKAWDVAMNVTKSNAVCDLEGGGYAVPLERNTEMKPPNKTKPILARVPSGIVSILPSGSFGIWRVVK